MEKTLNKPFELPIELVNEDETSFDTFPKNPLEEKWSELYSPTPKPEYSQVCDGYSCMYCGRCPRGSYWKVPDEDKAVWDAYQKEVDAYMRLHNPSLFENAS